MWDFFFFDENFCKNEHLIYSNKNAYTAYYIIRIVIWHTCAYYDSEQIVFTSPITYFRTLPTGKLKIIIKTL